MKIHLYRRKWIKLEFLRKFQYFYLSLDMEEFNLEEFKDFINENVEYYFTLCESKKVQPNFRSFRNFVNQMYEDYKILFGLQTETLEG